MTYVLWYASRSSFTLVPLVNGKGKRGMMWLDLLKIQAREGLSHSSYGEPSLEKATEEQGQKQQTGASAL